MESRNVGAVIVEAPIVRLGSGAALESPHATAMTLTGTSMLGMATLVDEA